MPRYVIGAAEVAVNPSNAEQIAPAGTPSPAAAAQIEDNASKEALKNAKGGSSPITASHLALAALVVGVGVVAYRESKKKKSSGGGHVIAGR